jgi:hypothetical protein
MTNLIAKDRKTLLPRTCRGYGPAREEFGFQNEVSDEHPKQSSRTRVNL